MAPTALVALRCEGRGPGPSISPKFRNISTVRGDGNSKDACPFRATGDGRWKRNSITQDLALQRREAEGLRGAIANGKSANTAGSRGVIKKRGTVDNPKSGINKSARNAMAKSGLVLDYAPDLADAVR